MMCTSVSALGRMRQEYYLSSGVQDQLSNIDPISNKTRKNGTHSNPSIGVEAGGLLRV